MCALGYVCITSCENSWGRGSGFLADQLYRPPRKSLTPALRFGFAVDDRGRIFENFFPRFRCIPKKCHRCEAAAVKEGIVPNVGDAIANRDARQAGALTEGHRSDASNTIRNCDTCQFAAA